MTPLRLALVLLFFVAGGSLAQAASFDCSKAANPFERAICGDDELSRSDETLAKAYATAIGGLAKPASDAMRADQRTWLDYAQRACTPDAQPMSRGSYGEQGVFCLKEVFRTRIAVLENSRMISGKRFYLTSAYAAMRDPDEADNPDSYFPVAKHEMVLPLLDQDDPAAAGFNAWVMEQGDIDVVRDAARTGTSAKLENTSDTSFDVEVQEVVGEHRISLEVTEYWYGHGAAHGQAMISYRHYLVDEGRSLAASDVFKGKTWKRVLRDLAWEELKSQHGEWLQIESADDIATIVADPDRWSFAGAYGITIQFEQYEVAAYAYGAPTVTIPWDKLSDVVADNQSQAVYGY